MIILFTIMIYIMIQHKVVLSYNSDGTLTEIRRSSWSDEIPDRINYNELNTYRIIEDSNDKSYRSLINSFIELHCDIRWPLPFSLRSSIISTYGQALGKDRRR